MVGWIENIYEKKMDGWIEKKYKLMDGWMDGQKIPGWLEGLKIYEKYMDGLMDRKNIWMAKKISEKNGWLEG